MRNDKTKIYKVWHEKGGSITVPAKSEEDAIEMYFQTIEAMLPSNVRAVHRSHLIQPVSIEGPFLVN